jgi:hypothetical protein
MLRVQEGPLINWTQWPVLRIAIPFLKRFVPSFINFSFNTPTRSLSTRSIYQLEELPLEMFHCIISYLDPKSITNLIFCNQALYSRWQELTFTTQSEILLNVTENKHLFLKESIQVKKRVGWCLQNSNLNQISLIDMPPDDLIFILNKAISLKEIEYQINSNFLNEPPELTNPSLIANLKQLEKMTFKLTSGGEAKYTDALEKLKHFLNIIHWLLEASFKASKLTWLKIHINLLPPPPLNPNAVGIYYTDKRLNVAEHITFLDLNIQIGNGPYYFNYLTWLLSHTPNLKYLMTSTNLIIKDFATWPQLKKLEYWYPVCGTDDQFIQERLSVDKDTLLKKFPNLKLNEPFPEELLNIS